MSVKYQTVSIHLPAGTPAGTTPFRNPLDATMDNVIGYTAYMLNDPGKPIRLRVEDDTKVYQQMTSVQDYLAGANVPKGQRYSPITIPAKSNQVTVTVQVIQALTADLDLDFVFMLEKKEQPAKQDF